MLSRCGAPAPTSLSAAYTSPTGKSPVSQEAPATPVLITPQSATYRKRDKTLPHFVPRPSQAEQWAELPLLQTTWDQPSAARTDSKDGSPTPTQGDHQSTLRPLPIRTTAVNPSGSADEGLWMVPLGTNPCPDTPPSSILEKFREDPTKMWGETFSEREEAFSAAPDRRKRYKLTHSAGGLSPRLQHFLQQKNSDLSSQMSSPDLSKEDSPEPMNDEELRKSPIALNKATTLDDPPDIAYGTEKDSPSDMNLGTTSKSGKKVWPPPRQLRHGQSGDIVEQTLRIRDADRGILGGSKQVNYLRALQGKKLRHSISNPELYGKRND